MAPWLLMNSFIGAPPTGLGGGMPFSAVGGQGCQNWGCGSDLMGPAGGGSSSGGGGGGGAGGGSGACQCDCPPTGGGANCGTVSAFGGLPTPEAANASAYSPPIPVTAPVCYPSN